MEQQHANARLRPTIPIFVSSSLSDMRHERNALQRHVFPWLKGSKAFALDRTMSAETYPLAASRLRPLEGRSEPH